MARKKRYWCPGAIYHVMSRGNRKTGLFQEEADYFAFVRNVAEVKKKYPFRLHAICLMTNHFHMEIETEDDEIWKIMHRLLMSYAFDFNKKYNLSGHLFENRYRAHLIDNERYFLEVSRYIHLNPVKAKMVQNPLDYKFSSYANYVLGDKPTATANYNEYEKMCINSASSLFAGIVDTSRILGGLVGDGRAHYRRFVEGSESHEEHESLIQKELGENELWIP